MARPALDKKLGMKQEKGKKRGRPPKEKVLQAVKSKPQKKESVRTILRRTTKEKKEAKRESKPKISSKKKVNKHQGANKEATTISEKKKEEPVLSQSADPAPAEAMHTSTGYISGSWAYLSELVRGLGFKRH